ncbi:hypothetical protein LMG22037_04975 [Paraburkholderia phenoliruptrix]|jgi:hypothetical protein|uniref:Uncharacterized protein n=1 Tax=Paraburkholderia phenoliruptrix TaxID=252970 RepID=A0A6J5C0J5_9BURK|nr:hypothetical protein [Paraburkholderia phenoliruptrix]CAB3723558.1 hypothetical protein LMG22037_04975 [Paraburkholderia phenoliruptrix]
MTHDQCDQCEQCAQPIAAYDAIHYGAAGGGYRLLCTQCFNAEVAKRYGLTGFENVRLEPIRMVDCAGDAHQFHFQMRLAGGNMLVLDAFEIQGELRAGYEFRMIGNPDDDVLTLLGRLVQKMRRALSVKDLAADGHQLRISDQTVRGRISSDMTGPGDTPVVVVDGREISWDDFGRMLTAFEGWQFRLQIIDMADEP